MPEVTECGWRRGKNGKLELENQRFLGGFKDKPWTLGKKRMGRRVIDSCHEAIWARLDRICGIYGASSADRWTSGSPALCFSLEEANRQKVKLA